MGANVYLIIGAVGTICGILFGYIGYRNGLKKDVKSEGKEQGIQKAKSEQFKNSTPEDQSTMLSTALNRVVAAERDKWIREDLLK